MQLITGLFYSSLFPWEKYTKPRYFATHCESGFLGQFELSRSFETAPPVDILMHFIMISSKSIESFALQTEQVSVYRQWYLTLL